MEPVVFNGVVIEDLDSPITILYHKEKGKKICSYNDWLIHVASNEWFDSLEEANKVPEVLKATRTRRKAGLNNDADSTRSNPDSV